MGGGEVADLEVDVEVCVEGGLGAGGGVHLGGGGLWKG